MWKGELKKGGQYFMSIYIQILFDYLIYPDPKITKTTAIKKNRWRKQIEQAFFNFCFFIWVTDEFCLHSLTTTSFLAKIIFCCYWPGFLQGLSSACIPSRSKSYVDTPLIVPTASTSTPLVVPEDIVGLEPPPVTTNHRYTL